MNFERSLRNSVVFLRQHSPAPFPRRGVTLIELLVVMTIILILLALLFPALHAARRRATQTVCQNNLHQVTVAMNQYLTAYRHVPDPPTANQAGGWSVLLLEFLEQRGWQDQLRKNPSVTATPLTIYMTYRPGSLTCPDGSSEASTISAIPIAHYILAVDRKTGVWQIGDAPRSFHGPWLTGPEMSLNGWNGQDGPHSGGFHIGNSDGSVVFREK